MSFTFERRTCGDCGKRWEALEFWAADMPCDDCGRRSYEARLAEINAARTFRLESIGGMCPSQAQGRLADGRRFYYRARHGFWTLSVGLDDEELFQSEPIAIGSDPTNGCVPDADVLAILDEHLGGAS